VRILGRRIEYSSPWLEVVVKDVDVGPPRGQEEFFAARTRGDYAAILAVTDDGRVPLVRQFRPAVEATMLELPSGNVEPGEEPADAIRRELLEETGCEAGELVLLGLLEVDSGRLETRQWAFFAPAVRQVRDGPHTDEPLTLEFVPAAALGGLVARGEITMANHLAVISIAASRGLVRL
jgi:ADP-ribose pyrophosphatase